MRVGRIFFSNPTHHLVFLRYGFSLFNSSSLAFYLLFSLFFIDLNFIVLNIPYMLVSSESEEKKTFTHPTRTQINTHTKLRSQQEGITLSKFQSVENLFSRYQDRSNSVFVFTSFTSSFFFFSALICLRSWLLPLYSITTHTLALSLCRNIGFAWNKAINNYEIRQMCIHFPYCLQFNFSCCLAVKCFV